MIKSVMILAQAGSLIETHDIYSIKLLGTSLLVHVAYAANELTALHLNGWLASTRSSTKCSETLHLPQLHLYRSATGYFICYLHRDSMS